MSWAVWELVVLTVLNRGLAPGGSGSLVIADRNTDQRPLTVLWVFRLPLTSSLHYKKMGFGRGITHKDSAWAFTRQVRVRWYIIRALSLIHSGTAGAAISRSTRHRWPIVARYKCVTMCQVYMFVLCLDPCICLHRSCQGGSSPFVLFPRRQVILPPGCCTLC